MIITRKIQIYIPEKDKKLRKEFYETLYNNRYVAVKIANMTVSHLFALDNSMPYLSEEDRDTVTFLGVKGDKATRRNAPYVAASEAFKGQIDMGVCSTIQNTVQKHYQEDKKAGMWKRSLRSYKANMPVPYQANRFQDIRVADYETKDGKKRSGIFFTLTGIPFQMCFGRDRSGNRLIVERVISGEYKMATSSIQIDDEKKKIFLLLCVDIPKKEVTLKPDKKMFAFLGVFNPIVCTTEVAESLDAMDDIYKVWKVGTEEEFNHRRRQIQEAVKRCQENNKYSVGGKGRKKKNKALDRYHDKEKNYVDTKLHTYSRMLVDMAVKHECSEIVLMKQKEREDKAKEDNQNEKPFVLRNWSYYGLKEKIQYKSNMYGIKITVE
jgi:hypothetical protein